MRKKSSFSLPLAVILGFVPLASNGITLYQQGGLTGLKDLMSYIVPYNPTTRKLDMSNLPGGLYPMLAGIGVHKLANMLGINRALASARIPFIRI